MSDKPASPARGRKKTAPPAQQPPQEEVVVRLPLADLYPFPDHPFQVRDDEEMRETIQSVKEYGVIVPAIVRPREEGGYEIVAGHRRKYACEQAGLDTMPVLIRNLDRDAATIIMVDSNLQRENILPSERAKAYKMKLEAIKRQGARNDLTSPKISAKLRSDDEIGQQMGVSGDTVRNYISLTNGSLYMLGAYLSLMLYSATGMNAFLAFFISIILTGGVGYLLDRLALRRLRNKKAPKLTGLITTLGMSMIIDNTIMLAFGSETKPFPNHFDFGRIEIGSVVISWVQIIILATALTLMLILSFVVYKTKIGKAMRCTSQNAEAARLMGISVNRVIAFTFIISGVLACISGNLVGMYYQTVDITMGASIGMKTFASAILGGVGVLPGAMVGGLVVGVIETFAAGYISSGYRDAISFVVLILVLLIKPSGLFGSKQINKV